MRWLPLVLALGLLASACRDDASSGCIELREAEDPQSGLHVLSAEITYLTNPPTSGPHPGVSPPTGVQDAPLPAPIQVRILEAGGVVVQTADTDALNELRTLATDTIVVAPAEGELPSLVVATAWTWKLECSELNLAAIEAFAESRAADAPGGD